jgi:hypothetical protein
MGLLKHEPTLEELEQQNEALEKETSNWEYRARIAKLKAQIDKQGGKGLWGKIVGDSKGGSAVSKAMKWLRGH